MEHMKISEIRKEVIDFVLADINQSLTRLGVSEKVEIAEVKEGCIALASKPIKQVPMMFKKVTVEGSLYIVKDETIKVADNQYLIGVGLDFRTETFMGGGNGCDIGYILYRVDPMPEDLIDVGVTVDYYVRKIKGITI